MWVTLQRPGKSLEIDPWSPTVKIWNERKLFSDNDVVVSRMTYRIAMRPSVTTPLSKRKSFSHVLMTYMEYVC